MSKDELVSECSRLLLKITKVEAQHLFLQKKFQEKAVREKNLTQQVRDTKKANNKLRDILKELQDGRLINAETAQLLKVID